MTSTTTPSSKAELLQQLDSEWHNLQDLLNSLSDHEWLNVPNPDGWTIKDHVTHITAWEESLIAIFDDQPRSVVLGVDEAILKSRDYTQINEVIRQNRAHLTRAEAEATMTRVHAHLLTHITAITPEALFSDYRPNYPFVAVIVNNTADHYRDHIEWMKAQLSDTP